MPTYEYGCRSCGPFDALRPMAERDVPASCPACGAPSPRGLFSAPALFSLSQEKRLAHATNERAAHAPRYRSGCMSGCGCSLHGKSTKTRNGAKAFPAKRPWMISH
jgi:putative FmdB family regulatory protein